MICRVCRQEKDASGFHLDDRADNGLRSECKACRAAREKKSRERVRRLLPSGARQSRCFVILSDVHVPEHDRPFWASMMRFIADMKPDEVILSGDFGEYGSVSQHGGGFEAKLTDDLTAVKLALDELRTAAGADAKITYLEGNHESRLPRAIASWAPTLAGSLDLASQLELDKRGIEWVPEHKQPIRRGLLRVLHGHQLLGKYGPKHHAAKAADIYGSSPGVEIVYGHVHTTQNFTKAVAGGYVSALSLGCGRTIGPDEVRWLQGREAGWHHGFGVAFAVGDHVQVHSVRVIKGRFIWAGRPYGDDATPAPV